MYFLLSRRTRRSSIIFKPHIAETGSGDTTNQDDTKTQNITMR